MKSCEGGFFTVHRKMMEHHVVGVQHPEQMAAWLWMISEAAWQARKITIKGQSVTLERGQFSHSIRHMAKELKWSKSRLERFIRRLETETMIGTVRVAGQLVITICRYSEYQDLRDSDGTASGTEDGTLAGQQRDNNKPLNQLTNPPCSPPAGDTKPRKVRKLKTRLPDGLPLTDEMRSYAIAQGMPAGEVDGEFAGFNNHHRAHGSLMADWVAAWQTWCRNYRRFNKPVKAETATGQTGYY